MRVRGSGDITYQFLSIVFFKGMLIYFDHCSSGNVIKTGVTFGIGHCFCYLFIVIAVSFSCVYLFWWLLFFQLYLMGNILLNDIYKYR